MNVHNEYKLFLFDESNNLRKTSNSLELLSFDEALRKLGIDKAEIRKEISKETE